LLWIADENRIGFQRALSALLITSASASVMSSRQARVAASALPLRIARWILACAS